MRAASTRKPRPTAPVAVSLVCILAVLCAAVAAAAAPTSDPQPLTIYLFYSPSCPDCHAIRSLVRRLQAQYPAVTAEQYDITVPQNIERMADFYTRYEVPEEQWGGTMAVFVGDKWWADVDSILTELEPAVDRMVEQRRPARATGPGTGHQRLLSLFERFGPLTVAMAGLVDGVNPCALAALVFLLSYLTLAGRTSRQILATGLLFAAGVFLAYLGVGLGLFRGLQSLSAFSLASRILYPLMALGTLVLTALSFRDYLRARAGGAGDMTLVLPPRLMRLTHGAVRNLLGGPGFLALAFAAGAIVSLLELFCTGQVYVPTLMYVWSSEGLRTRAFALLVLYVAMFTVPVIALVGAVYAGVTSRRLATLAREHAAATKLAMTFVFALLTAYLIVFSLHVF